MKKCHFYIFISFLNNCISTTSKINEATNKFSQSNCLNLLNNTSLIKIIKSGFSVDEGAATDRKQCLSIVNRLCTLARSFKTRLIYDVFSESLLCVGLYSETLRNIISSPTLTHEEEYYAVKIFELAATSPAGISQLCLHLDFVLKILIHMLKEDGDIEYSTVTVLFDLTASEECFERVAAFLLEHNMYEKIYHKLSLLLQRTAPGKIQDKTLKLRDLYIDIVLNLACNVEAEQVQLHFIEKGVVPLLTTILFDSRNDWPSNGSALALLQYAHMSIGNIQIFQRLIQSDTSQRLSLYMTLGSSPEILNHVLEALNLFAIAERKQRSILQILVSRSLAAAA